MKDEYNKTLDRCPYCNQKVYHGEDFCWFCSESLTKYNMDECCPECGTPRHMTRAFTDWIKSERYR